MRSSGTHSELDGMIVEIELTLASIVQGVALYFLIENSRAVLSTQQRAFWPYIFSGLLTILIFWSRSVVHTLTLIRWPLEFGHNFFYIGCALAESLLFTRIADPQGWFTLGAIYAGIVWLLFVYDLRLIRARERDSAGEASNRLYALLTRDQWLNIGALVPALFFLNLACALCIYWRPDYFLAHHFWLGGAQLLSFSGYLLYVIRFFKSVAPLIQQSRQEWHDAKEKLRPQQD
jgi:hypothetical protein